MNPLFPIAGFYGVSLIFCLAGYGCLVELGLRSRAAWTGARLMGMLVACFPAWWAGSLGCSKWQVVGYCSLAVGVLAGLINCLKTPGHLRDFAIQESFFMMVGGLVLLLRLPNSAISGTEKPMDFGILMTLSRAESFPPPDMWLAGESLPYYYWGYLPWTLPMELSRIPTGVAYNLIVASLAGQVFVLATVLGYRLSGHLTGGLAAAGMTVLAGTPDGLRQLMVNHDLAGVDIWRSSRLHPDVISEFPLFSFWLGDLHPHLLSVPMMLLSLLVALEANVQGKVHGLAVAICLAWLIGLTGAANPWALPPTLVAIGLLMKKNEPAIFQGRYWLMMTLMALGSFLATAPFWLYYAAPTHTLATAQAWTATPNLLSYVGALLVPALGGAYMTLRSWGKPGIRGSCLAMSVCALFLILASILGEPTLVILTGIFGVLTIEGISGTTRLRTESTTLQLAALGVGLLLAPEIVYLVDGYGERLHRMNTVFKSYFQAWILLALVWPALLRYWIPRPSSRGLVVVALIAVSLPHPLALSNNWHGDLRALGGFGWMTPGDRAAVAFLREQPAGTTLIEAVGEPYSHFGRISSASGVPAYLGWMNHELVWRGSESRPMLEARYRAVNDIYNSGQPNLIQARLLEIKPDYVVIGSLERARYPSTSLNVLRAQARVVLDYEDTALLVFGDSR